MPFPVSQLSIPILWDVFCAKIRFAEGLRAAVEVACTCTFFLQRVAPFLNLQTVKRSEQPDCLETLIVAINLHLNRFN